MEQRIKSLEEEVKLLKNQIRAVLLDIKENLASGDWQAQPLNNKAADPVDEADQQPPEGKPVDSALNSRPEVETKSMPASRIEETGCDGGGAPSPPVHHTRSRQTEDHQADQYQSEGNGKSQGKGLEPLTLMLLLQWLEKAQSSLGREQTRVLIELYCSTGDLSDEARQTLQLVTALYGKDKEQNPDLSTIPYLLELDQLLNNQERTGNRQNLVLKFLSLK
jgi:archaellum component FlaD/FlaE